MKIRKPNSLHIMQVIITIACAFAIIASIIVVAWYVVGAEANPLTSDTLGSIANLLVAVVALLLTYYVFHSIDRVNKVSSMEGNVLTEKHYSLAYYHDIAQFKNCFSFEQYANKVIEIIKPDDLDRGDLVSFAEQLQIFIDNLIWVAYLNSCGNNEENRLIKDQTLSELKNWLKELNRRADNYKNLNSGVNHLLDESIGLIASVLFYQTDDKEFFDALDTDKESIADVRGEMIGNPISQLVYFDYLGLYYLSKGKEILKIHAKCSTPFKKETSVVAAMNRLSDEQQELLGIYLSRALLNFEHASHISEGSLLWDGYIRYNKDRSTFLLCALKYQDDLRYLDALEESIDQTYKRRKEIQLLIENDICAGVCRNSNAQEKAQFDKSFIASCFSKEVELVEELRDAFSVFRNSLDEE